MTGPSPSATTANVVAVTGASGFIGAHFVRWMQRRSGSEVRALVRSGVPPQVEDGRRIVVVEGSLTDGAALARLLRPGCAVVNFAYDGQAQPDANFAAAEALARACIDYKVKRLVHCSTAVVVGTSRTPRIDESTVCAPRPGYEETKLVIERLLLAKGRGNFEVAILRPTAVFGPAGRNLVKLAQDITRRPRWENYLRSCINGRRRMNLVSADNVAAATVHVLESPRAIDQQVFIVSDDDAPANNFRDVEQRLMRTFGIADYPVARIGVPKTVLSLLLRIRGRALSNPDTVFSSDKLKAWGFVSPLEFSEAVNAFASWYQQTAGSLPPSGRCAS
jgi:nucleoside-diphosphate-sugar epimerase